LNPRERLRSLLERIPTRLTKSGWWYVGMAALFSAAAYQSANNVLFLALAFLLSALLLNGLLSWWNYSRITLQNLHIPNGHAGQPSHITFTLQDAKTALPSMGLIAVVEIQSVHEARPQRRRHLLPVRSPGAPPAVPVSLEWTPTQRGSHRVKLLQLESYFPFGFILKVFPQELVTEVHIWPAVADTHAFSLPTLPSTGDPLQLLSTSAKGHQGSEPDIVGLRPYRRGDPKRQINWKKTAQTGRATVNEHPHAAARAGEWVCFDFSSRFFTSEAELHAYCSRIAAWVLAQRRQLLEVHIALHHHPAIAVHSDVSFCSLLDQLAVIAAQPDSVQPRLLHGQKTLPLFNPVEFLGVHP
jgi:uncharacterized protein (DUF58 family)